MDTDVLIIGCGIAGATAALRLARNPKRHVTMLSAAADPLESNTGHAQGGIVYVEGDDVSLVDDIVRASAFTASPRAASFLAGQGGRLLREVLVTAAPVAFDADASGRLKLGLEGGHSRRRIVHVADGTGRAIATAMIAAVARTPNITLLNQTTALDLLLAPVRNDAARCIGASTIDASGVVRTITARATIVATGGLAATYLHTTNPAGARGDGIAMAARAGARVRGLEFVQFHPTALAVEGAGNFLVSEAVRGEGAVLVGPNGRSFMHVYSPEWGDLAPRDVVARAIDEQMLLHGAPYVYLDLAAGMSRERILSRFPAIAGRCLEHGIDITREPIPVRPAAHYTCGGIVVDAFGRTSIPALYAIGEASNTGLHGANRLASTSLLEGLVWGATAADDIEARIAYDAANGANGSSIPPETAVAAGGEEPDDELIERRMAQLREVMWNDVGIVRNALALERASDRLGEMQRETIALTAGWSPSAKAAGLRNAIEAGLLVARAAGRRRESRGCHFREDAVAVAAQS
jgi:L-aspartate oxidase